MQGRGGGASLGAALVTFVFVFRLLCAAASTSAACFCPFATSSLSLAASLPLSPSLCLAFLPHLSARLLRLLLPLIKQRSQERERQGGEEGQGVCGNL